MRTKTIEDLIWCEYANLIVARNRLIKDEHKNTGKIAFLDKRIKEMEIALKQYEI